MLAAAPAQSLLCWQVRTGVKDEIGRARLLAEPEMAHLQSSLRVWEMIRTVQT